MKPFRPEDAQHQKGQDLGEGDTAAVQQHIPGRTGPQRQESLVEFVEAGNESGAEQSEKRILKVVKAGYGHPPGPQPEQAEDAISDEMAGFPNVEVNHSPLSIRNEAEERLVEPAEWGIRLFRAKQVGGRTGDQSDADEDGKPGLPP